MRQALQNEHDQGLLKLQYQRLLVCSVRSYSCRRPTQLLVPVDFQFRWVDTSRMRARKIPENEEVFEKLLQERLRPRELTLRLPPPSYEIPLQRNTHRQVQRATML